MLPEQNSTHQVVWVGTGGDGVCAGTELTGVTCSANLPPFALTHINWARLFPPLSEEASTASCPYIWKQRSYAPSFKVILEDWMATCRCGHCASGYTGGARHFAPSLGSSLLPHLWNHTRLCFHVLPSGGPFIYSPPRPLTGSASKRKTLPLCSRLTIHSFTPQLPRG